MHLDFCYLNKVVSGRKYVSIIKNYLSSYDWLYDFEVADADTTADALLDWFVDLGLCGKWVSEQSVEQSTECLCATWQSDPLIRADMTSGDHIHYRGIFTN